LPPIFRRPLRWRACARWVWDEVIFPYGVFYLALAALAWHFWTPSMETMATLRVDWIAAIYLRNAALLTLVAGALHYVLYIRRRQDRAFKFDPRWPARDNRAFLWGDQVKDNMFWSLASGALIWSLYESLTLWLYASGRIAPIAWHDAPLYFAATAIAIVFWGTLHFYCIHRWLHWPPLYRLAHELHHRNVNTIAWSGISMHPIEHVLFFSVFMLWWIVPVDPIIVIATGFYMGLGPAFSHCGFERVEIGRRAAPAVTTVPVGTYFHNLHHRYFEVNYGNPPTPLDHLFGTWHDGTDAAHQRFLARRASARGAIKPNARGE
ncbi:MAG: sterol desaturase family protein, partial [bacterium]